MRAWSEDRRGWTGMAAQLVALVLVSGCALDRSGLGEAPGDAGARPDGDAGDGDAATEDAGLPDGFVDPGIPCPGLAEGAPTVVAVLSAAALFGGPGAELAGLEVEAPGQLSLALQPWRYGALLERGYDGALLGAAPSLADVDAATPLGMATRSFLDVSYDAGAAPNEYAFAAPSAYTIAADGELFLPAGPAALELEAGHRAVVELDVDGVVTRVSRAAGGVGSATATVPREGWYPLRLAWSNDGGAGRFRLFVGPPGGASLPALTRLRARLDAVRGRDLHGYATSDLGVLQAGDRIDEGPTVEDFRGSFPRGINVPSADGFTVRWLGRARFDEANGLVFATGDDTFRLWVDGVFLGGAYGVRTSGEAYEVPVPRGVHDVIFELEDGSGNASYQLMHRGAPLAAEAWTPRTRFGGRVHGRGERVLLDVGAAVSLERVVTLSDVVGRATLLEVSAVVETFDPSRFTVTVTPPGGAAESFPMHLHGRQAADGRYHFRAIPARLRDVADANGDYRISIENAGTSAARWWTASVLAHVEGTEAAYGRRAEGTSAVVDLGDEAELLALRAMADLPFETSVDLHARAGPTASAASSADWIAADGRGDLATPIRGRFLQVRLSLAGPGTDTPRVRELRAVGHPCLRCLDAPAGCEAGRATDGQRLLYRFDDPRFGDPVPGLVRDLAGGPDASDLFVREPARASFAGGTLVLESGTVARRGSRPRALAEALAATGALTVEAWATPRDARQTGPARLFAVSRDTLAQDLVLGQSADRWELRLVTSAHPSGTPPLLSPTRALAARLQHVVVTYEADGTRRMYVDAVEVATDAYGGDLRAWDGLHGLALGNEQTLDRAWLGELHLLAVFDRALTPEEVARHHGLGPD